jgi:hypothetical protein
LPPPSPTSTATKEAVLFVSIDIYGSSGELVKRVVSNVASWKSASDFDVLDDAFAPKNGTLGRIQAAGFIFGWDGTNDNGALVSNGTYTVKMQQTDSFGHVQTLTHAITVVSDGKTYCLRVFNSAGELVRTLPVPVLGSQNAPSQISTDSKSFVPSGTGASGTSVKFDVGTGVVAWDGRNDAGQIVSSGNYVVQLAAVNAGTAVPLESVSVSVLDAASAKAVLGSSVIYPNPLLVEQGNRLEIQFATIHGTRVVGKIYNLAGELVVTLTNDQDEGKLIWNIRNHSLASGIYMVALWAQTPWGETERRTMKLVIFR